MHFRIIIGTAPDSGRTMLSDMIKILLAICQQKAALERLPRRLLEFRIRKWNVFFKKGII
jgi:hypothetical protein